MASANSNAPPPRPSPPKAPLLPIDEVLFGSTRVPPGSKDEDESNAGSNSSKNKRAAMASFQGDSILDGRWGQVSQQHDIDLQQLRKLANQGSLDSEQSSCRAIAWRVLLGYLPTMDISNSWKATADPQRKLYQELVADFFEPLTTTSTTGTATNKRKEGELSPDLQNSGGSLGGDGEAEQELAPGKDQEGSSYDEEEDETTTRHSDDEEFGDDFIRTLSILEQLPKQYRDEWKKTGYTLDPPRRRESDISMVQNLGMNRLQVKVRNDEEFQELCNNARVLQEIRKDVFRTYSDLFFYMEPKDNLGAKRYGALERILFVWARLNGGVRYVQGMNEIVGTLFYVLANDEHSQYAKHAEADTYYLFHNILTSMKDVFVPELDESDSGIQGRIANLHHLLQKHDPEVSQHLSENGIDVSFFAIRWLTTLLSREFVLPDTIRLWDSMFASTHRENFLRYVCVTMILFIRNDLLVGDLSTCLRLLQNYPSANVDDILESSRSLYLYETQISMVCQKGGISLHEAMQALKPPPRIIMAYGLKGGIVPKLSDRVGEAAQAAQEQISSSKIGIGLAHKARGLWNKFGASPAEAKPETGNVEEALIEPPRKSPPPSSRIWRNRSASKSPPPPNSRNDSGRLSPTPPPTSRIWNRTGSKEQMPIAPDLPNPNKDSLSTASVPTEDGGGGGLRSRLWNRGRSTSSNESSNESTSDQALDMGGHADKEEKGDSSEDPIKISLREDTKIPQRSQKDIMEILGS